MKNKLMYRFSILRKLAPFAEGVKKYFFYKLMSNGIIVLVSLLLPYVYGMYIEKTIMNGDGYFLFAVISVYIGAAILNMGCELFSNKCTYTLNNKVSVVLRLKFLDKRFTQKFSTYNEIDCANEKMLLDDAIFKLCAFSGPQSIDYFLKLFQTVCLVCVLLILEWRLALIMIISIPVTMWLNDLNARMAKDNNNQTWNNN